MDHYDLNAIMARRGIKQGDIARRLGVTQPCVSNIVRGKRRNARVVKELARVLRLPIATVRAAIPPHPADRRAAA